VECYYCDSCQSAIPAASNLFLREGINRTIHFRFRGNNQQGGAASILGFVRPRASSLGSPSRRVPFARVADGESSGQDAGIGVVTGKLGRSNNLVAAGWESLQTLTAEGTLQGQAA
jgi:hypothetical protein